MKTINSLKDLKREAICLVKPILVRWPQYNEERILEPFVGKEDEHKYAVKNNVVAFVDNNIMYVIPYMIRVIQVLKENDFSQGNMYVPFSQGDYPLLEKSIWFNLEYFAHNQAYSDFSRLCSFYCDSQKIGYLDANLIKKCMQIPVEGISVKRIFCEDIYYPKIIPPNFDNYAISMLGKYCTNNGVCIFIYRDGSTYVTKSSSVINFLPQVGYVEGSMFVPFSREEKILVPKYEKIWNTMPLE